MGTVALCFLLRGHPQSCAHWRRWRRRAARAGFAGEWKVLYHCDAVEQCVSCGAQCVLHGAERIPSIKTSWGDAGVVQAESKLYEAAFADARVACAVLLTDWCAPVYEETSLYALLTRPTLDRPLARLQWSVSPPSQNRFRVKCELQKVVDRALADLWRDAVGQGPTRAGCDPTRRCSGSLNEERTPRTSRTRTR